MYILDTILSDLELNYTQFIDLCILCGCDYTCTIPKVGPVNALKLIKKHITIDNFENVPKEFDYQTARRLFIQNENYHYNITSFCIKPMDITKVKEIFERYSLNNYFLEKLKILLK